MDIKTWANPEMAQSLENVLISVWRQALVEGAKKVETDGDAYPVKSTQRLAAAIRVIHQPCFGQPD